MRNALSVAAAVGFALAAALVGCSGGSGSTQPAAPQSAVAYLVYPPSAPFGVMGDLDVTLVFATRGVNASYQAMVSSTPPPCPQCFSQPTPSSTLLPLDLSPTSLPTPLAVPSGAPGTLTYVTAHLPFVQAITSYAVSLVGCASVSGTANCTNPQVLPAGSFQGNCGFPPPVPTPGIQLASPPNGTSNVPTSIGEIILQGFPPFTGAYGSEGVAVTTATGGNVVIGQVTAAPSPLPSPIASPLPGQPYVTVAIPTLSPATTYTVTVGYPVWANEPPTCSLQIIQPLGSFTTQ